MQQNLINLGYFLHCYMHLPFCYHHSFIHSFIRSLSGTCFFWMWFDALGIFLALPHPTQIHTPSRGVPIGGGCHVTGFHGSSSRHLYIHSFSAASPVWANMNERRRKRWMEGGRREKSSRRGRRVWGRRKRRWSTSRRSRRYRKSRRWLRRIRRTRRQHQEGRVGNRERGAADGGVAPGWGVALMRLIRVSECTLM